MGLSMSNEFPWIIERFGPRGARLALVSTGVLFMTLIAGWSWIAIGAALAVGHGGRAAAVAAVALGLVALSLRIMRLNWLATRAAEEQPVTLPDGNDQSGVWGVGGPSMREPGSTGAFQINRVVDRRYEREDD
jgi:hypothetical protein